MSSSSGLLSPPTLTPSPRNFAQAGHLIEEKENGRNISFKSLEILSESSPTNVRKVPFAELVGNFGYTSMRIASPERAPPEEAPTKRRRIELADMATLAPTARKQQALLPSASTEARKRLKSPTKKKPQTITALATAAYRPPEQDTSKDTVSEFFTQSKKIAVATKKSETTESTDCKVVKRTGPRQSKAKAKAGDSTTRSRKPPAPKKPKKPSTKNAQPQQPLYTPERANAQMRTQDFLFGSSSQLAAPESPSFIREMQLAVQSSELTTGGSQHKSYAKVPHAPLSTNLSIGPANRELWCTGARDLNGGVARTGPSGPAISRSKVDLQKVAAANDEKAGEKQELAPKGADAARHSSKQSQMEVSGDQTVFIDLDEYYSQQQKSAMTKTVGLSSFDVPRPRLTDIGASSATTRPSTNPSLSDMLDLDSIPKSIQQTKQPSKRTVGKAAATGKSAKARKPTFIDRDAIQDDEPRSSATPPRKKRTKLSPGPKPLSLSPSRKQSVISRPTDRTETGQDSLMDSALSVSALVKPSDSQWKQISRTLFPKITTCVRSASRITSGNVFTWHEKILLYDPIILEDFTMWLNQEGIKIMVTRHKRKMTTKGKGRKKKVAAEEGEEAVRPSEVVEARPELESVEETLQPWMVQKWCEDNSICCCSKDTFKGNARARY